MIAGLVSLAVFRNAETRDVQTRRISGCGRLTPHVHGRLSAMTRRTVALAGAVLALLLPVTACGGSSDATSTMSTHDVLALGEEAVRRCPQRAPRAVDRGEAQSGDAVLGADGTLTHQPAFEGKVTVVLGGFNADVPVVAIDDKVYAKLPLTPKYVTIDPAEYSSPNPADFANPDQASPGCC